MLSILHIENIAVIETADILFEQGFHVLTGETGAGKSIIIDAISAVLGERTSREVIRTGAARAFVSAIFTGVPELAWFSENGTEYDAQELQIQRELYPDGRNVCRVNGRPVTVANLHRLGMQLINIHGQHDSQQLFDEQTHLTYLDLFARDEEKLQSYRDAYEKVQRLDAEIRRLSMDEAEKLRLVETLQYQIDELERAELEPGEEAELSERRKFLQNAEKIAAAMEGAVSALYGDESSDGAAGLLTSAERELSRVSRVSDQMAQLHQKIADLMYAAQDAAEELRDLQGELDDSAGELEQLEDRLDVLHKLMRKYGGTEEACLDFLEKAKARLDEVEFASDRIEKLRAQRVGLAQDLMQAGQALRAVRQDAAERLRLRIESELAQLDMPKIRFLCEFSEQPPQETGLDAVRFLMSANVGEALRPMAKVASGGELARIMLAMKNVLAEQDAVPTLIFDEVDAGVSGRAAQKVAEKLKALSDAKQILCITHLPQIAAKADVHMLIRKAERDGRTYTSVTPLDREGRIGELSRIIGGAVITDNTRRSAEEMLD